MSFELDGFIPYTEPKRGMKPQVSIRRNGVFGLNQGAVEHFDLESFPQVQLYFNPGTDQIAIELLPSGESRPGAVGLRVLSRTTKNAVISAKSFLLTHGIDFEQTRKYDLTQYEQGGRRFLVFDLSKPSASRRSRSTAAEDDNDD